jgi:alpha-galactosidase
VTLPSDDTIVRYRRSDTGRVALELFPAGQHRDVSNTDSLVQVKLAGEPYAGGFGHGHTMRNTPSLDAFRFHHQESGKTTLTRPDGCRIEHQLTPRGGVFEVVTTFINDSPKPVTLEMLSSFSLGGIVPGRLRVHRFRSVWSAEGRLDTQSIEQLHLEKSWAGAGAFSERFGQIGTMPVRKWFPFVAVEDTEAGIVWGAQLAWAGSWQMEIYRQHDDVCLSGGLADREFGHWMKTLAPGESLVTPPAIIACVHGSLDDLCDRLTAAQRCNVPAIEEDLPIVFNEWCTTWGDPQHDKVVAIAKRLKGTDVRYLVIDAGWYKAGTTEWHRSHGDWIPSAKLFPQGLEATAAAIREQGLVPGLWFEMETCGADSAAFSKTDWLLKRDGVPVTVGHRRFWDLNNPQVVAYLTERVIDLLERGGFGYLKVDYNDTLGMGTDDPDGLRQQVLASYRFFEKIRERLPELVIESCSSGGHRLEPSMLARTAMSSFSDAHESPEIPIIAANLHRLMLPRQSQIWAVLHKADSDQRLAYSLAATFLGRMCLSGEIAELTDAQWQLVLRAQEFYRRAAPIIKHGTSRRSGAMGESWRHPTGWQAVVRTSGNEALVVLHAFENAPAKVNFPLPPGTWRVVDEFPQRTGEVSEWTIEKDFSARVALLQRTK